MFGATRFDLDTLLAIGDKVCSVTGKTPKELDNMLVREVGSLLEAHGKRKRPGKPPKNETPGETKIIGALNVFLKHDNRGKTAVLALSPGGFTLRGKRHSLTGRPRQMLQVLLASSGHVMTANDLRQALDVDDEAVAYPEQVVLDTAKVLRRVLRQAAGLQKANPLPSQGRGRELCYRLDLELLNTK
jgi:hypothetical protein